MYDSDANGTFQATGQNGSRIVYPQGTVSSNVNDGYYYPSFQSFDVTVTNNDGTYSTGPGTLTSYLNGMYGTMVYAVDSSDQKTQNANANLASTDINTLFGGPWTGQFGTSTSLYSDNSNSKWSWVTGQAKSLANIAESQKFAIMQNSLQWVCLQATMSNNAPVALQKKYQNYSFSELSTAVNGGTFKFSDIFTSLLTADGQMNPWTQQMYTDYQSINNQVTNNSKNSQAAAQNTSIINTAGSYLANYVTGNDSQMTDSNYSTVYTDGTNSDTYPKYVPQVTYNKTPNAIAAIITDTTGSGDSVSAGVYTADGSSNSVNIGSSSSSSSSVEATASDWFWTTSVSASMSSANQQSFGSYDSAAAATTGTFDYGNLSFQSWDIPQTGNNAWLLATQIEAAVSNDTPYIYSPSFSGGYGWTDSKDVSTYTAQGLSYMKSLAFSGDPTTTITIQSDSNGSTYWSDNNYQSSSYSASGGFSFGDWFGGVGVGASTSSSDTYSDAQSSSTWNAASNTATLVSHPLGPIATTLNNANAGYPAMQVGAGVVDVVAANSNYSSSASNRGKIETSWHNVNPANSGKNIKMDSSDNIIFGSSKRDVIKASKGDDELFGHDGRDALVGGSGDDFLSGGTGKDSYSGGPGKDFFELNSDHFGTGLITIIDFNQMADTLWCVHVNDDLLTAKGKGIFYDGDKVARVLNLNKSEVAAIVENNTTFVG
jgi:hypothetical protein